MNEIKIQPASEWSEGKEGFFRLDEETYRAADGWSQSMLKTVLRSPACVEQSIRYPMVPTWPMELGTLTHKVILEPETFGDGKSHYVQPSTYESEKEGVKPWNANSGVCKKWLAEHTDKPVLSPEEHQTVLEMHNQFHGDEFGSMFAKKGSGEVAIFHKDAETGVMLKGKLDLFAFSPEVLLIGDLKICASGDEFEFAQQCARLKYHVQTAFYLDLVEAELRREEIAIPGEMRFLHCTLESKRPHFLEWRELDQEGIYKGRVLYKQAIADLVRANETEHFALIRTVSLPKWAIEM